MHTYNKKYTYTEYIQSDDKVMILQCYIKIMISSVLYNTLCYDELPVKREKMT